MSRESSFGLSSRDRERMSEVQALAQSGERGIHELVKLLSEPSWVVRRAVVAALGRAGAAALRELRWVLENERANEARVAATVDALVASSGDVESELVDLASTAYNPAVICDIAQIFGRRKSYTAVGDLARWCTHADDNIAVAAIEALGRIGGSGAVVPLIAAVESGNFFRVFPAIAVLGQTGDPRAVPPLTARLAEPHYMAEAAAALGRTGQLGAIDSLAKLLGRDRTTVRTVARALSDLHRRHFERFGDPEAIPRTFALHPPSDAGATMADALAGASVADTVALATVLGWLRDTAGVTALVSLLEGDGPAAPEAFGALRSIAETAEPVIRDAVRTGDSTRRLRLLPLLGARRSVVGELIVCLDDPDAAVRAAACDALGRIGDPSAVGALFGLLGDADARVAQAALGAVQSLGSDDARAHALDAARSPEPRMRRAALRVISYFGYPEGREALLDAIVDDDERIREAAAAGLVLLEDSGAARALLTAATHASAGTRAATMRAFGGAIPTSDVVAALVKGLSDADAWVRYYACQSLGKLHVTAVTDDISRMLGDEAGQVRVAAVEAIAKLGGARALAVLDPASQADDPDVRRAALLGLGLLRRPHALPILLRAADSDDPTTRLLAISAIADSTVPEAMGALSRAVTDVDPRVRDTAFRLLAARPGPQATRWLIERLVRDEDREQALTALASAVDGRIEGILATMEGADETLASWLVQALVRMRRANANAALESLLHSDNVGARRAAAAALSTLGTVAAHKALEDARTLDPDPEARRLASSAH